MVAGRIAQLVEEFLPVADDGGGVGAPAGRNGSVALPRFEGGLADASNHLVLGTVLVRAVVDLAEEQVGEKFRRVGLRCEDGAGGLARALQRAGAGRGEGDRGKMPREGFGLCSPRG